MTTLSMTLVVVVTASPWPPEEGQLLMTII
jgi:hypothetical protein